MTKRVVSEFFGTFSHHVVTKRIEVTKSADSASDMTRFVTLVTKRAATPLPASHHVISRQGAPRLVVFLQLRERAKENWHVTYPDHFATRFRHVSDVTHITKCLVSNPLLSLGAMVLLGYRSTLTLSLSLVRHNYDVNGQVLSSVWLMLLLFLGRCTTSCLKSYFSRILTWKKRSPKKKRRKKEEFYATHKSGITVLNGTQGSGHLD